MKVKLRSIVRLALPYILTALLPILSVLFLSALIIQEHTEKVLTDQNELLEVATDRVEAKLYAIEELAGIIADDTALTTYIRNAQTGVTNNILSCIDIQKFLAHVSNGQDIVDIYFYDVVEDRIISSDAVFYESRFFFDNIYQSSTHRTDEIMTELQTSVWRYQYFQADRVILNGREENVMEYRISVPLTTYQEHFQLVLVLDIEYVLQDYFDALSEGAEYSVYFADNLIYSSSDRFLDLQNHTLPDTLSLVDDTNVKLYGVEHKFHGSSWRVRFYYPKLAYADNRNALVATLAPVVAVPVIICVTLCIYFTHKKRVEIMEILSLLRSGHADNPVSGATEHIGHKLILTYAGNMAQKFAAYEARLREVHASQKNIVLERLLRNAYRNNLVPKSALEMLDIPCDAGSYIAICVQFEDESTAFMITHDLSARDIVEDLLETNIGATMEVFDNLSNEIVAILTVDDPLSEISDNVVSLLNVHIKYRYGLVFYIGIGDPVNDISEIHKSYNQAREVIHYNERTGRNLSSFGRMYTVEQVKLYPLITDEKISNYMILGRAEDAKDAIMDIYREYFCNSERILSLEAIDFIKYRITNTVLSVAERQGLTISDDAQRLLAEKNAVKYFEKLTALVDSIVNQISSKKSNAQNVLAVKVHGYIRDNYADCSLTIKQIAAHFHFHENYVSNLYKDEYNENLSTAIEKIRIEKACELLGMTETKIGEVAAAVGYSSDSSFRRAFKRFTGVSPVDYRNSH